VTAYEARYRLLRPYDHPLRQYVYRTLRDIERQAGRPLSILDVGGRRSQYTIGLKSRITITDIPKETALQERLDLGTTDSIRGQLMARRSNVADYVIDDMTRTQLAAGAYDVVVAIEVIEHVDDDEAFVRNVSKVLAPGGHVVLTTPNGDFRPVPYADHRRHYTRRQLSEILRRHLSEPRVGYLVNEGALMRWGTVTPSFRRLARTLASPVALGLATHLERLGVGGSGPHRKLHLVASARKAH
jgi:SAM-dependent methyltransferase